MVLRSIEVTIEKDGSVRLPKKVKLSGPRRAILTILKNWKIGKGSRRSCVVWKFHLRDHRLWIGRKFAVNGKEGETARISGMDRA